MNKSLVYVPDGNYSLNGVNITVSENDIYILADHKIHYGTIDSSTKKSDGWLIGFLRLGRIKRGEIEVKRDTGILIPQVISS